MSTQRKYTPNTTNTLNGAGEMGYKIVGFANGFLSSPIYFPFSQELLSPKLYLPGCK